MSIVSHSHRAVPPLMAAAVVIVVLVFALSCAEKVVVSPEVQAVAGYVIGDSTAVCETVHGLVRAAYGDPAAELALEKQFVVLLKSTDATPDAKDFFCRELWAIGSDYSVKTLGNMLEQDTRMADMARYALQQNMSEKSRLALEKGLKRTEGTVRIGILNTLGERGEAASVPAIAQCLNLDDATVLATIRALGKIGGAEARGLIEKAAGDKRPAVAREAKLALARMGG